MAFVKIHCSESHTLFRGEHDFVFPPLFLHNVGEIRYITCICPIKDVRAVTERQRVEAFYLEMVLSY